MPEGQVGPATWEDLARFEAKRAKISPALALAVMHQESSGQPTALGQPTESGAQARGLFQLMPETAKGLGVDPTDPLQNIRGGVLYLKQRLDANGGDVSKALADYHGGPDPAQHGPKTAQYVQDVLGKLSLKGQTAPETTTAAVGQPPPSAVKLLPLRKPWETIESPKGPPPTTPPEQTPTVVGQPPGFLASMLSAIDPRAATGRRNIAGGLGAAAGTAAVVGTAPVSAPVLGLGAATAGILGAIGGGMTAESGEQLVGTAPPSGAAVVGAGAEQGALETVGQLGGAALRSVARWPLARHVGRLASEALSSTKQAAVDRLGQLFESAIAPTRAGRAAKAVIEGPAQTARDLAGKAVEQAAQSGPDVNIRPLKAEAQRILTTEIKPPATAFPRAAVPSGEETLAAAGISPGAMSSIMAKGGPNADAIQQAIAAAQGESEQDLLKHPAMGVLSRILNADDKVPFAAAHQFKRDLDQAVGTAWDRSVQKRVTNITKTLRGTLREALAVHPPYNQATAQYAAIAPLYTKEIAAEFSKVAQTSPEKLIQMIQPKNPSSVRMLRDLLTEQAEAGGGGQQGTTAWNHVRSAWTRDKLIQGGVDQLGTRIAKFDPEFTSIMYGDASGQQVLTNLKAIDVAYQRAIELTPELAKSTLAPQREGFMYPSKYGVFRSVYAFFKGPSGKDLVQWAAITPDGTQRLVRAMLGPEPGAALADLLRVSGIGDQGTPAKERQSSVVGQPPPNVGMPPP